jgi:hypothetical protein
VYVLGFIMCAPIDKVYQKGVSEKVRLPQPSNERSRIFELTS